MSATKPLESTFVITYCFGPNDKRFTTTLRSSTSSWHTTVPLALRSGLSWAWDNSSHFFPCLSLWKSSRPSFRVKTLTLYNTASGKLFTSKLRQSFNSASWGIFDLLALNDSFLKGFNWKDWTALSLNVPLLETLNRKNLGISLLSRHCFKNWTRAILDINFRELIWYFRNDLITSRHICTNMRRVAFGGKTLLVDQWKLFWQHVSIIISSSGLKNVHLWS